MARRMPMPRRAARRVTLALIGIALLTATGCGVAESGNTDRGQVLFTSKCASCHALKDAGSTGALQGPDLDAAFAQARASGMDSDTVAGVVKAQVENPRPSTNNPSVSMPANLVTGDDLEDVASYVASVAGVPGIKGPQLPNDPGATVFANNQCSGCHTLKAAGASGTTGPDLDKVIPGMSAAEVKQSIVDPSAKIAPGYADVMPKNFAQLISPQELNDLVNFLLKYSGSQGGGKQG
ncbi:MAG TPA: cytochrome c [Solirubrobacterales bacterium]|nr:cytochrome c [Solirubrobacterales bacterium]